MIKTVEFSAGEGKHRVSLLTTFSPEGLVCQLYGGEKPHVGAVVLSVPRPSLKDPAETSTNSSILPLLGHKDDELARPIAEEVVKYFKVPVVVVAGLHIEQASAKDISLLMENSWQCVHKLKEANK